MCVSLPPSFRRQIWFGSSAERSRENPLVIKEFILSYQCRFLLVLMQFIRGRNCTLGGGSWYLHKSIMRARAGLCSVQIAKHAAIIHLATNHWAESYVLLNCTQVENQIYNEGEMLFLSIIGVICGDMRSEKRARNERKMQISPIILVFMHRLYTLEIKDLSAFRAICCSFVPRGEMPSCHLCFWLAKWFMPQSLKNSDSECENTLWLHQMCTIKQDSHCNLGYLVYMKLI